MKQAMFDLDEIQEPVRLRYAKGLKVPLVDNINHLAARVGEVLKLPEYLGLHYLKPKVIYSVIASVL